MIVLSDSDEPASPVAYKHDRIESKIDGKYYSDTESDFNFPEVPFCSQVAKNLTSQSETLPSLNANDGYKCAERLSSDSEGELVEKSSRKAAVSKKNKETLRVERSRRQQALAREKALKSIERKTSKDMKPGECMKFMEVNLDRGIDTVTSQEEIESALRNAGIKFNVTTELISNSITWQRNIEEDYVGEDNEICTKRSVQLEKYVIMIWSAYEAVRHVADGTFCVSIMNSKDLIPNYNMTLLIYGMEEYFVCRKKQKSDRNTGSKESRYNGKNGNQWLDTLPTISRQQLEMCLTEIQIVAKCSSRLIENIQDLILMVCQYTKSISEIPYKLQKKGSQESKFDWYVMGDNKNTVRVDKDGNGLKRLWQQQLCQFNLSTLETSEAICTVYPSPVQLVKAYKNCTLDEGMNLLKDISIRRAAGPLTTARKIGPELSKKIYAMFMSQNGNDLLGTEV